MTWTKQRQGPSDHRYIIDEKNRFIASMDNEATDEEWAAAVAAPALLESLQEMVADLISHASLGLNEKEVDMLRRAEAAIAKATAK